MEEFIHKLGVDWRLLLSQIVNFLILLTILRIFAYKPILKILHERKKKIEEGLTKAKEADTRLSEIQELSKEKLKEAEHKALQMLRNTEEKAKRVEVELLKKAQEKETAAMKSAELAILGKREEAEREMQKEAAKMVKEALVKTVGMDPKHVDEALIQKALTQMHNAK